MYTIVIEEKKILDTECRAHMCINTKRRARGYSRISLSGAKKSRRWLQCFCRQHSYLRRMMTKKDWDLVRFSKDKKVKEAV